MPKAAFTKADCHQWVSTKTSPSDIVRDIALKIISASNSGLTERIASDNYPWVFGLLVNPLARDQSPPVREGAYGIIHHSFAKNNFNRFESSHALSTDDTYIISRVVYFSSVHLTHEEALLLQFYCGIKHYSPAHPVAMPLTIGLIFTLLLEIMKKEALSQQNPLLLFVAVVPAVMILYPVLVRLLQKNPLMRSPVVFNYRQLWQYAMQLTILLGLLFGIFPYIEQLTGLMGSLNEYASAAITGAMAGVGYALLSQVGEVLADRLAFGRPVRATLQRIITPSLVAPCTFATVLTVQTFLANYLFSQSDVEKYQPKATLTTAVLIVLVLTLVENFFLYIFSKGLHWLLYDRERESRHLEGEEEPLIRNFNGEGQVALTSTRPPDTNRSGYRPALEPGGPVSLSNQGSPAQVRPGGDSSRLGYGTMPASPRSDRATRAPSRNDNDYMEIK